MAVDTLAAAFVAVEENADLLRGPQGSEGKAGLDGHDGSDGKAGLDGRDGVDGKAGTDGQQGPPGQDGADGEDGLGINWLGPWKRGWYRTQDAVEDVGSSYIARGPTNARPPKGAWDLMAKRGADGQGGVSYRSSGPGGGSSSGTGSGLPAGGVEGQALVKASAVDGDADWTTSLAQGSGFPAGNDELQNITITGTPNGGTFALDFDGQTTAAINFDATAADVQATLEALSNIGASGVTCDGGPLPDSVVTVLFTGALGRQPISLLTLADNSLSGGTSPDVLMAEVFGGMAPVGLTTLAAVVYDINSNGLFANIGTIASPDWVSVEKIAGYDANGNPLGIVDSGATPTFVRIDPQTGQETDRARIGANNRTRFEHIEVEGTTGRLTLNQQGIQLETLDAALTLDNDSGRVGIVTDSTDGDLNDVLTAQGDGTAIWAPGSAGGGTPASTVTDETTYGIAPAVGTDTEYARQDHTHGSPTAPAPSTADYLVGTAQGGLSAEIVVGTSPGGELGGTWASPTVDATHSGSSHASLAPAAYTLNAQTADYTLVLGDASKLVEMNKATALTLTVPPNSSVAFAVGAQILFSQLGAGQLTVAPGAGVTLRSRGAALKTFGQYSMGTLVQRATDEWYVSGDTTT